MACGTNTDIEKSAYYAKLTGDVRERYDAKIEKCGGIDPYAIKPKDLSTNPKDFPEITIYDIGDYMIHSISPFTKRFLDNYKGTDAYRYFESGFVLNMGSRKNNELAIVQGKVRHSQRMNESPLRVWILANLDGKIICAHCTCIAGLSEACSHVGAICFAINKISESKETKSVTDILCKWNVPSFKEVSMSFAIDITWRFPSRERSTLESSFLEYCKSVPSLSDARLDQFLLKSQSVDDDTALETILYPSKKKRKTNLRDEIFLTSLYNEKLRNKNLRELVELGKAMSLSISSDEAKEISRLTLPELKSKCSLALRRGRITGFNFKSCCVADINDPSVTTIRRVINLTRNLDHIPSIKYHTKERKKAVQHYIKNALLKHKDFVYDECGLIIKTDIPCFAGSPDGLMSCSCHGNGCIEIKCLNIQELDALDDFLTRKPNNMFNKYGNQYCLEESHEFFYRVQLQINLTNSNYCDCVIWSPQRRFMVTVNANIDFWMLAMEKVLNFHEQVIMPELLAKFYTDSKESPNSLELRDAEDEELELLSLEIELLNSEEGDVEEVEHEQLIGLDVEILNSEGCMNADNEILFQLQYSPVHVNLNASTDETASYRTSSRVKNEELTEKENFNKSHDKLRSRRSIDLFGSDDDDAVETISSSSQYVPQEKRRISPRKTMESSKETVKIKKTDQFPDTQSDDESSVKYCAFSIRNLMDISIEDIIATYPDYQKYLTELYSKNIKGWKIHYKSKNPMAYQDVLTYGQQDAMMHFLTEKLVRDADKEHNYVTVLIEAILPEWTFGIFCKKFNCTREEAMERLHLQASMQPDALEMQI